MAGLESKLRKLFSNALQLPTPQQQAAYLDQACVSDAALRARLEELLQAHREAGSFLEEPAATRAAPGGGPSHLQVPGAVIGPYKLLQQIGEGGMGVVFMAEQTRPVRRKVALKVIKPGMDSRQVVARFEAERQALAMMDHANIARVLDGGATEDGRPYFVMELVHGVPITRYCDDNHLTPRERLELFTPVCQAIQHAHQKGIIHRDIKPSNVMVTLYDGKPAPKVIDFGVAKATDQRLTDRTLFTQYGTLVGTLEYMSPEQAETSALGVDTRSDIYSLGVLLYELLTGSTPLCRKRLKEAEYAEILRMIKEEEPPKPSTRLSASTETLATISAQRHMEPAKLTKVVKGELDWIVMKCLDKDRNRRYDSANGIALDVQRYLKDEPVEACPPSTLYRFRKFARRHKRGLLTASIVALAVMLTAAASGVLIWQAAQDLHQALHRERDTLDRERRGAYFQRIALAEREWATNNLSRMEELLDACPEDLRGWEWRYLKRLRYRTLPPLRHDSPVLSVAFSPTDGKLLATGAKEGVVRIWHVKTGEELRKWLAHLENVTTVLFSPDGRRLASGSWDGTVKVWDVEKVLQGEFHTPRLCLKHTSRVRVWSVAFSPDGQRLASAGGRDEDEKGEVKVWDANTGQEAFMLSGFTRSIRCAQFSPDGRRLAACFRGGVHVWDAQTGREQLTFADHERRFQWVAFSPDGRRLAAVDGLIIVDPDGEVKVWDVQTGQEVLSLRGHVGGLRSLAFSPDGRRLASGGLDQTVKLWDALTGQEVVTLRGHIDYAYCLAFSADGHQLASGSLDNTVRIWDATPLEQEPTPEYLTLRGHAGAVTDLAFHPTDGRSLVSASADGTVRTWDFRSGKELGALRGFPSDMRQRVAYSSDGRRLAVVSGDREGVRVWDVAAAQEAGAFSDHRDPVLCLAFSPDGRYLASAGFEFIVQVWDTTSAQELQPLKGHTWPILGLAFSPNGRRLVSASGDNTVRVWDWTSGQELRILEPRHAARVQGVAFSRDGELLASASWDRTIKVWETRTWKLVHNLPDPTGAVECVAFGNDRRRIAWGSTDSTVKVWDGPGTQTHVLRGHTSWVQGVAFSHDGQWIGSASLDGTVKIWQAPPEPKALAPEAEDQEN